jgi:hypothetical membrane protein
MKAISGIILIIVSIISLFRYKNLGASFPETIGALIGLSFFLVPGILLVRSAMKEDEKK